MAVFKYDIVTLIELVESRPCIWDKTNDNSKNKILREKSWREIFEILEDDYDQLSQAEKKKTGEIIMTKWSNIRDAFLRSLKTKSGQGAKKKYLYSEHLQFLLKTSQKNETNESNFNQTRADHNKTEFEECAKLQLANGTSLSQSTSQPVPSTSRAIPTERLPKSKWQLDFIEREIPAESKKAKSSVEQYPSSHLHHQRSDQEMLLLSFLPYLRDMNETELMDFQMEVITTIKKIKQRRVSNEQSFSQMYDKCDWPV